jgi:type II secretory pathway predicted ATPase ExeA
MTALTIWSSTNFFARCAACIRQWIPALFTDAALDELHRYSAGSARAVNKAGIHCLIHAAQRAKKLVDDHMVKAVIDAELP